MYIKTNRFASVVLVLVTLAASVDAEGPNEAPVLTLSLAGGKPATVIELSAAGAIICQTLATTLNAAFAASQPGRFVYGCATENGPKASTRSVRLMASKGGRSDIVGRSFGRKICDSLALVLTAAAEDDRSAVVFACEGLGSVGAAAAEPATKTGTLLVMHYLATDKAPASDRVFAVFEPKTTTFCPAMANNMNQDPNSGWTARCVVAPFAQGANTAAVLNDTETKTATIILRTYLPGVCALLIKGVAGAECLTPGPIAIF